MINKLAKVISAGAVLAMAVSFAPESAVAQKFSGNSYNQQDEISFDLDTSKSGTIVNDIVTFKEAIQSPTYTVRTGGNTPSVVNFKSGDLTVSKVELPSDSDLLRNLNNSSSSFTGKFQNAAVEYAATLEAATLVENEQEPRYLRFKFYAPYTEPFTQRNSLSVFNQSSLTEFLNSEGKVRFPVYTNNGYATAEDAAVIFASRGFTLTPVPNGVTKVPEPAATASLLGFGIVSTALLRKRNKRLETSLSKS
jgi:hypothetical protein